MRSLAIKAVVRNPDGSLFYREEHEWSNIDDQMMEWFTSKLQHLEGKARDWAGKGEDDANLSAVLSAMVGGVPAPDVVLTGISYAALVRFERLFHNIGDELIRIGEDRAKGKAKGKAK